MLNAFCMLFVNIILKVHCCCCCCVALVMSDSVLPHRRQPTRLPSPWDSPGKNTGVGCHFLLQCMKVKSESEVAQSCPTLCDHMDCSPPGSSIHGIFQARVLEWGAIVFSKRYIRLHQSDVLWLLRLSLMIHHSLLVVIHWIIEKAREFQKNTYFCFVDYAKVFDCVNHNKLWEILQEMGIPDHLTYLLRNLYAGQEATVRTGHGTTDWFQIRKGVHQGCILLPCLFNFYAEYIMRNAGLDEAQAGIKTSRRNINNLRYADDTHPHGRK